MSLRSMLVICVGLGLFCGVQAGTEQAVAKILEVGPEGRGIEAANQAWEELNSATTDVDLMPLLESMKGANPLAANYLRAAVEAVTSRLVREGKPLPKRELTEFVTNRSQGGQGRLLAFDLLKSAAPGAAEELVPGMLDDPYIHLRRLAVDRKMGQARELAGQGDHGGAITLYQEALDAARDADHIRDIARALGKLGHEIDLPRQFGFVTHWQIIGPFDNSGREGFGRVYPPEQDTDLAASYPGKSGEVGWRPWATADPYGKVDFNQSYTMLKGALAYAYAEYVCAQETEAELRLGTKNAWKVWHNGELLFGRDEYHRGQRIDQYRLPVRLRAGPNHILVKCCQDEQQKPWTVEWEFKLRVCDPLGAALLAVNRLPTPEPAKAARRRPNK